MSYILDALQRADQERNLGEVPKLDTALQSSTGPAKSHWLLTAVMVLIVATVVASLLFMLQHGYLRIGSPESPPTPTEATSDRQVAKAPPAEVAPAKQEKVATSVAEPKRQAPPEPVVQPATAKPEAKMPPAAKPVEPTSQQPSKPLAAQPSTASVQQPKPEPAAKPAEEQKTPSQRLPTPTVAPVPPPSWVKENNAQSRRPPPPSEPVQSYLGLSESFRNRLPKLNMNAHVFSTNPARSFVLINNTRYRIGDYLAEGPELADILPDGAVLKYRGETFLLPVGR